MEALASAMLSLRLEGLVDDELADEVLATKS